jgi:hypothetical protein
VRDREPLLDMKERGVAYEPPRAYHDLEIPQNSPAGVIMGGLAFVFGFAMVWGIWWLAILFGLAMWATMIWRSSDDDTEYVLVAEEVERLEGALPLARGGEVPTHEATSRPFPAIPFRQRRSTSSASWALAYLMATPSSSPCCLTYGIMVGNTAGGPTASSSSASTMPRWRRLC